MVVSIRSDCCIALRMIALQAWYASEQELWEAALIKLANASDDIGVMFFDTDDLSDEVEAMREATLEARAAAAALKEK